MSDELDTKLLHAEGSRTVSEYNLLRIATKECHLEIIKVGEAVANASNAGKFSCEVRLENMPDKKKIPFERYLVHKGYIIRSCKQAHPESVQIPYTYFISWGVE